ncbi:MAG: cyclase family protein [Clostridia bacterium]|nr:cyclase family protein [Clostridia bacterium]
MAQKLIDLSQEIFQGMPIYPLHQKTFIFQNISHDECKKKLKSKLGFATNNLLINEHAGTHCDAVYEYNPLGQTIDQMSLDYFWGPAICLDVSHVKYDKYITKNDLNQALQKAGLEFQQGDIVLLYTGTWNRLYGTDEYLIKYTGLTREAAEWLADQGVVNIGVDSPSIDHPDDPDFVGHGVCAERNLSNTEHLANLDKVAGKRFLYFGLPLKIRGGSGSPIRAIAILNDQ